MILHRNHQVYFSAKDAMYEPFVLPPTEGDTRHFVQAYFEKTYGLELSVRPVHRKEYRDGSPFIYVHTQIQRGVHNFKIFTRMKNTDIFIPLDI